MQLLFPNNPNPFNFILFALAESIENVTIMMLFSLKLHGSSKSLRLYCVFVDYCFALYCVSVGIFSGALSHDHVLDDKYES